VQTIGDLVDQLSVVNIKLFMNQEGIHSEKYKKMTKKQLEKLITTSRSLNLQRNQLIDEINSKISRIVSGEETVIEFEKHKTGGE